MTPDKTIPDGLEREAIIGTFGAYLTAPLDAKERLRIVARNMAICRKEAGMSQREVCQVIGCAPQTYSGYEKGKHEPTLETLVRLSHLYNVTLDVLLGRNEYDEVKSAIEDTENFVDNPTFQTLQYKVAELEQQLNQLKAER